eukprot:Seg3025.4 transcript_id=Seg3025.4/GoldUCD/mRNA.D3Y31 product="hypothetical protein" protein_id=Seg3025.4/GoldUCD/D3Y31
MLLTPKVSIPKTKEERTSYEALMSDFIVALPARIQLDPNMKWRMGLMEAYIPLDLRRLQNYQSLQEAGNYWFRYGYGFDNNRMFREKHYFHSASNASVLETFSRALNEMKIGNPLSLLRLGSAIELGVADATITGDASKHGNTFIRLKEPLQIKCAVFLSIPLGLYDLLFGKTLNFTTYRDGKLLSRIHPIRWSRGKKTTTARIISREDGLKEGTTFVADEEGQYHTNTERGRLVDIECDLLESNYVSGAVGKILKTIHDDSSEVVEVSKEVERPTFLPMSITEFNAVRIRLLHHYTKQPLQYEFSSTVGRPYISVMLEPY